MIKNQRQSYSGGQRHQGFTLPELMVTLAVLAILVTIAVPSFNGLIATQKTRNASLDLSMAVTMARSEAVKQNTTVTMSTTSNWASGWVLMAGTTVIRNFGPYSGVAIVPSAGNTLSIGNDGRPTAGMVTFQVNSTTSGQSSTCVQVVGTGRVAVTSGAC